MNLLALMAVNADDLELADATFKRIGDNWNKETWKTKQFFDQERTTSAQIAPFAARSRAIRKTAEDNMGTPKGAKYRQNVQQKLAKYLQKCVHAEDSLDKFELFIQVGKGGSAEDGWLPHPTKVSACIYQELGTSRLRGEIPFSPPPQPSYWVKLELDPASFVVAAK
jgi:hypothetical protein